MATEAVEPRPGQPCQTGRAYPRSGALQSPANRLTKHPAVTKTKTNKESWPFELRWPTPQYANKF